MVLRTEEPERLFGMLARLSTSTMNLLGTVAVLDTLLTLESGTTPKAKPVLSTMGRRAQVRDFMVRLSKM